MKVYTVKELKALRIDDAGTKLREPGGLVGLVRASKAGAVSVMFTFEYKRDGKKREAGCGTWPAVALAGIRAARDAARALLNTGVDPIEARRASKLENQVAVETRIDEAEAVLSRPTFEDRFEQWKKQALVKRKDKGAETERAFKKDVLPALGSMAMEDVRRSNVMDVLDAITARGANRLANRTLTDLKQLFKWCLLREHIALDPLMAVVKKDVGGAEEERERVLSDDELKALPAALEASGLRDSTKAALWLILGTNVRIGEVAKARKEHINMETGVWRIPSSNSKNTDTHTVYLSAFAKEHMAKLLALSASETWLIPTKKRDGTETHIDSKSISKQLADRQLKFYEREAHANRTKNEDALVLVADAEEPWTPHDLRRTAATLMQKLGVAPQVVDRCMNHREQNRMKRIYQRYDYAEEQRDAWRLLGDRLALIHEPRDNVRFMDRSAS